MKKINIKQIQRRQIKEKYVFETNINEIQYVTNNITIKTVNNKKLFEFFYGTPWKIYKNDPNWVPPLWLEINNFFKKKNPFWTHAESKLFILEKNQEIVARIAAFIDHRYCKTINKKIGFFGFFECINDFEFAEILLKNVQNWLVSKGMTLMQGPINGRIDVGCGFLYSGFDKQPTILSSYSPGYYISFAEKFNMKKTRDQIIYNIDLTKSIPNRLKEKADKCAESGIKIRKFNRLRTNKELNWWIEFFLDTLKDHWGYVPVSNAEVKSRFGVKQLRWIVDPDLFLIAELNGKPVAYIWSTPDYNQIFNNKDGKFNSKQILKLFLKKNQIKTGKLHFIGIKKGVRHHNIGSYLNYETLIEMKKRGYTDAEVGWIDEHNKTAHKTIAITGAKLHKKYRVFEKNILNT